MKNFAVIAALLMPATPIYADISDRVSVTNCKFNEIINQWMDCSITNHTDTAILSVEVKHIYTQEGRAVPWVDTTNEPRPYSTGKIAGGVEPGETIEHLVRTPGISSRADVEIVDFQVTPIKATLANGEILE
ncbi:MAG: hypothetical protein ABJL49_05335 [Parasphingorhabdus sp.]|uniref:hypothetical protein n=1 Tax=Alphaproteobacteria TaxID=28211 RepID=UPI003264E28A